jgi:hypothetical protein
MSLSDLIFIRSACHQISFLLSSRLLSCCCAAAAQKLSVFSDFRYWARFILKNIIIDHHIESEPILPKFTIRYASLISKYKVSVLYQDEAG